MQGKSTENCCEIVERLVRLCQEVISHSGFVFNTFLAQIKQGKYSVFSDGFKESYTDCLYALLSYLDSASHLILIMLPLLQPGMLWKSVCLILSDHQTNSNRNTISLHNVSQTLKSLLFSCPLTF